MGILELSTGHVLGSTVDLALGIVICTRYSVSSTYKADHHDITEILLTVVLNVINYKAQLMMI
jgi:hypothetical protein